MEFYGLVEAKDWFGVVGWFGFVGYGLWVCCAAVKPQTGGGGGCEGLVWGGGGLDLWVCCDVVKHQTIGGGGYKGSIWGGGLWIYGSFEAQIGGYAGYVVVLAIIVIIYFLFFKCKLYMQQCNGHTQVLPLLFYFIF